ncbi:hypothetical protein SAMN04487905_107223 [Actinopolyspora xinjiangensis]|uniref:Uncharacterized protein n=1 Tax=Actinopolyspora xinjiangensis TaxID=405564 RepID=A0A1H0UYB8_9ACTN|nr:hypothetical protein [Actinopolyspora xinjiangensis]SDP71065.1 hypothetical protein SAMN04487905_107223 [Actinopolyspora xinjiangensis]
MESFNVLLFVIALLGGSTIMVYGALGWMGRVSASSWARWTRANREGGRNQMLLGLLIGTNGAAGAVSYPVSLPLAVVASVAMVGFATLSVLHRRKYGPRPQPGSLSPYAAKRLAG